MTKFKILIEYDGSKYSGWQRQLNGNSIQESIENAVYKLTNEKTRIFGAGRTDSGVHAKGQVAHFSVKKKLSSDNIRDGINQYLRPEPISIIAAKKVEENFHARFSANFRIYEYIIINRRAPLTIEKNRAWIVHKKIDLKKIKNEIQSFKGKHDFQSFRSISCQSKSSIKTINDIDIKTKDKKIKIKIKAKSFLHSQVRIIVGTLIDIACGKIKKLSVKEIIKQKDRSKAGVTAPACGLYLLKVGYKK